MPSSKTLEIKKRQKEVKKLYQKGKTREEIAKKVGRSRTTIHKDIGAIDVPSPKKILMEKRRVRVAALREQGLSIQKIATALKVHPSTIDRDIAALKKTKNIDRQN